MHEVKHRGKYNLIQQVDVKSLSLFYGVIRKISSNERSDCIASN
ncbi:hypothetical protein Fsol_00376 [Candidatus Fokinia solitaria]|uniref:Uncharacterized protein n=1 Tax=Candidatus Fokinia solitaria TaxID=1802984 RepID=A0A2U8BS42_9RICK|nr:hypothetical protein [Candidatus Fokinia solitaria]AWD33174.1 hypothetical protein Fsol_00376 [Candidatus Fokinia solitaria]